MIQADWGPTPTDDENREWVRRSQAGDAEARHECLRRNTPLVLALISRFRHRAEELEDMTQEGRVGLLIAMDRFDLTMTTRFATYAYFWIRSRLFEYVAAGGAVRVPRRIRADLKREDMAGIPHDGDVFKSRARIAMAPAASVDARGEDGISFAETLEDRRGPVADDPDSATELLKGLRTRERDVLVARVVGGKTLMQIGKEMGVCKERVRQIESAAIRRLQIAAKESA